MNAWRRDELRQCLGFVRSAYASMATGDLGLAFRRHNLAATSLGLARRYGGHSATTATATLSRVLRDLADRLEDTIRSAPAVHPSELVPVLFEVLQGLQRDGVEVTDEALMDKARNQAMALAGNFRITAAQ